MTDRFSLRIDPLQPYQGYYPNEEGEEDPCPLRASMAEASWCQNPSGYAPELLVNPYGLRHLSIGWPEPAPEELELEHFCITNCLVNHFGGKGTAQVVGPCPSDSTPPPYEPWEDADMIDEASSVTYRDEQGQSGMYVLSPSCGRTVGNGSSLPKVAWNAHRSV